MAGGLSLVQGSPALESARCNSGPATESAIAKGVPEVHARPQFPWSLARRVQAATGGHNAWLDVYGLMSMSKLRFYSRQMHEALGDHLPYADLGLDLARMRRWHPLNRSIYLGARVMLPGLLLAAKGDRVAMHSSVETRYPFLDEAVFSFCSSLPPRWKLRGLCEKYALRRLADRWLPRRIAWRRKAMFRRRSMAFTLEPDRSSWINF